MAKWYPVLYLFLYRQLRVKATGGIMISSQCVMEIMRRRLHKIPRQIHHVILKEMEDLGLIKKRNTSKYEILAGDIDKILNNYCFFIDC